MEIERKFVLEEIPANLPAGSEIEQAYLTLSPEVRIRKREAECYLTIKGEGDLVRDETEVSIPRWVFDALWGKCELRIVKRRHTLEEGTYTMEIDVYHGSLLGLVVLEVEFVSTTDAAAFQPPVWVGTARDVTADKRYKNKMLARDGRPPV